MLIEDGAAPGLNERGSLGASNPGASATVGGRCHAAERPARWAARSCESRLAISSALLTRASCPISLVSRSRRPRSSRPKIWRLNFERKVSRSHSSRRRLLLGGSGSCGLSFLQRPSDLRQLPWSMGLLTCSRWMSFQLTRAVGSGEPWSPKLPSGPDERGSHLSRSLPFGMCPGTRRSTLVWGSPKSPQRNSGQS
jgi:hypothetical protein